MTLLTQLTNFAGHAETFSAYSSFITKYDNSNYSTKLPAANKIYAPAVKVVDDGREAEESKLTKAAAAPDAGGVPPDWAFANYIAWENDVKRPRVKSVQGLYQRATAAHSENVELWETWVEFGVQHARAGVLEVCERAVRAVAGGAVLWAAYMRAAVSDRF